MDLWPVLKPSTFSIVAFDARTGDLGVAVESKFIAVGALVPWAKANVGAIATQAWANISYGPDGLKLLEAGFSASETLRRLLGDDPRPEVRQVAIVDGRGEAAVHTGRECMEWAGHVTGAGYSCQGNILSSSNVVQSMAKAYEESSGDLVERLLRALSAGQAAGGDRRGEQSAALLVVKDKGGYEGFTDRYVDLRVDDHPHPIQELERIFKIYDTTILSREDPKDLIAIDREVTLVLQRDLNKLGIYHGPVTGTFDDATKKALTDFVNVHNFENRMRKEGLIWKSILEYLEDLACRAREQ